MEESEPGTANATTLLPKMGESCVREVTVMWTSVNLYFVQKVKSKQYVLFTIKSSHLMIIEIVAKTICFVFN
jgi:hypothetical protein